MSSGPHAQTLQPARLGGRHSDSPGRQPGGRTQARSERARPTGRAAQGPSEAAKGECRTIKRSRQAVVSQKYLRIPRMAFLLR
jgi:hypothetical protein